MADDRLKEAVDIVAHGVVRMLVSREIDDAWGDLFPEVGEYDWQAVDDRVRELMLPFTVDREMLSAAVEFLEQRADHSVD